MDTKIFIIFFLIYSMTFSENKFINKNGTTIKERFLLPEGFEREEYDKNSFEEYLRNLSLKKEGEKVKYYDGKIKNPANIYIAVVDMDIGSRNLQQCADSVIRLRAEYLYNVKRYNEISFKFTNGFKAEYIKWAKGERINVKNNKVYSEMTSKEDFSYKNFRKYLDIVFAYAGTISLEKELKKAGEMKNIRIGDVFIEGGNPGHAVIVTDTAINKKTNEKIFLLAQGYMPAQEIQILINTQDDKFSPWYSVREIDEKIITPEWNFSKKNLKRF